MRCVVGPRAKGGTERGGVRPRAACGVSSLLTLRVLAHDEEEEGEAAEEDAVQEEVEDGDGVVAAEVVDLLR